MCQWSAVWVWGYSLSLHTLLPTEPGQTSRGGPRNVLRWVSRQHPHSQPCTHPSSPPPLRALSHTHLLSPPWCVFQGSQSPKEKQTPWAGSNSSPTVPVRRIPLQRKFLQRERQREKGGYDNRGAEQTISSPDTGKLVLKVTCFWTGTRSSVLSCHTAGALCIANWLI